MRPSQAVRDIVVLTWKVRAATSVRTLIHCAIVDAWVYTLCATSLKSLQSTSYCIRVVYICSSQVARDSYWHIDLEEVKGVSTSDRCFKLDSKTFEDLDQVVVCIR